MQKNDFTSGDKRSGIDISKSTEHKLWQRPDFNLFVYLLAMLASFYPWQDYSQSKSEEIP